jgi:hypothetical protein
MDIRICPRCGRGEAPPATRCRDCAVALTVHDEQSLIGQMLGNYRIERVIGAGGKGVVFGAKHATLLRDAAIKVLQPSLDPGGTGQSEFARRFLREARLLAALEHPAIVGIYDFDVSPMGFPYLVMPWLRGESLRQLMQRHPFGIARSWIAAILDDVAAGLGHAHRHGVVHRDLKPENVFLTVQADGVHAKLLDFGIAHAGERVGDFARTATGTVMGTPLYQAPEQLRAEPVSPATDQYSLALLVAEMLRGQPVRQGRTYTDIVTRAAQEPLPRDAMPEHLEPAMYAALARATQPRPDERFENIDAFCTALRLPLADRADMVVSIDDGSSTAPLTVVVSPPREVLPRFPLAPTTPPPAAIEQAALATVIRRKFSRLLGWIALAVAVVAAATAWWIKGRNASAPPTAAAVAAMPAPAPVAIGWLRENGRIALPPGVQAPLSQTANTLVVRTAGGWALLDLGTQLAGGQVPLVSNEHLLGSDDTGQLWIGRDGAIDSLDPLQGRRESRVKKAPALVFGGGVEDWSIAPSGRWIARLDRDGSFLVLRHDADTVKPWIEAKSPSSAIARFALDDRHAVVVRPNGKLETFDLEARGPAWQTDYADYRVFDIALDGGNDVLAIAGDRSRIALWRLGDGKVLAPVDLPRPAQALLWAGDGEHLLSADTQAITVWKRDGESARSEQQLAGGAQWLFRGEREIIAGDEHVLRRLSFGAAPLRVVAGGAGETWSAAARDNAVYVGGDRGDLVRVDAADGSVTRRSIHSAGIPDLHFFHDRLVSSSDDRTLAVWRLPALDVEWRAKGHAFLVNQLASGESLWSSSSDGSLRRWHWPELEPAEAIDLRARSSPDLELHAFWVSPDDKALLVGTWANRLLHLRREDGAWKMASAPIEAHVGYRMIDLPARDAVLVVGILPGRLLIFDRHDAHLEQLPRESRAFHAATPDGSGSGAWLGGAAEMAHLQIERAEGGHFRVAIQRQGASALGVSGAMALLADSAKVAVGNDRGDVLFYPAFTDRPIESVLSERAAVFVDMK